MIRTNKTKEPRTRGIWPYIQAIPEIIIYELISKLLLVLLIFILKKILMSLVLMTGRVAVTSGDFAFIFTSPYGWLAILITFIMFGVYIAFDINIIVNYCGAKALGKPVHLIRIIPESLVEAKLFFTPGGILVLLFSTLITPMIGIGMSISLTNNLYVPNFISSVIESNIFYNSMYIVFQIIMFTIAVLGMFTIQGMILDNIHAMKSFRKSAGIVRRNFKDILVNVFKFILKYAAVSILLLLVLLILPGILILIGSILGNDGERFGSIAFALTVFGWILATSTLFFPVFILKITHLYYKYTRDDVDPILKSTELSYARKFFIAVLAGTLVIFATSYIIDENFDEIFPAEVDSFVVGHRGSGSEPGENTVLGIRKAMALNCFGAEIDIQRTADGYYVLNHDKTFKRVAGVDKAPSEMTLSEIKQLKLKEVPGEKVPTIDEVLDVTGNQILLFIELKGATADVQMCEDIVHTIKSRNLMDTCCVISLKYDLIDYIETKYPEIQTCYLAFISLGMTADLNCDYLGLEEQVASSAVIDAAHENGKRVLVWTPNTESSQRRFLLSDADAIITDEMSQANSMIDELKARDYLTRIIDEMVDDLS